MRMRQRLGYITVDPPNMRRTYSFIIEFQYDCQQMRVKNANHSVWWKYFKWSYDDTTFRPVDNVCYGLTYVTVMHKKDAHNFNLVAKADGLGKYGMLVYLINMFFIIEMPDWYKYSCA